MLEKVLNADRQFAFSCLAVALQEFAQTFFQESGTQIQLRKDDFVQRCDYETEKEENEDYADDNVENGQHDL